MGAARGGSTGDGVVLRRVGAVRSTLTDAAVAPRQPDEGAPEADLVIDAAYAPAVRGLAVGDEIVVVTWLDRADRDVLEVHPRDDPARPALGVFSTRSQHRPNPLGIHHTRISRIDGTTITVSALEALDGTPIVDVKPALGPVADR